MRNQPPEKAQRGPFRASVMGTKPTTGSMMPSLFTSDGTNITATPSSLTWKRRLTLVGGQRARATAAAPTRDNGVDTSNAAGPLSRQPATRSTHL